MLEGVVLRRAPLLYLTVLVIATCGLVYELLAATLASYVLGDSVTQFSLTIGVYLSAMGLGSYLSRFLRNDLCRRFIEVELAAALLGGCSAPLLFICFAHATAFRVYLYGTLGCVGVLVGLEIPLLMRILKEELDFSELVAKVLTFDYLGALFASILFALVLVPELGLNRTSLLFGILNGVVGLFGTFILADRIGPRPRLWLRVKGAAVVLLLLVGFVRADALTMLAEQAVYADSIIYAEQTNHQRIVLTRRGPSLQLFLNGNLQLSSSDEHRYHEALVHPAFAAASRHARVLILGGGDGMAAREVLRYRDVEQVTLVDLDPGVTNMARTLPALVELNRGSLDDPRVEVVNDDAMVWLDRADPGEFDVIVVDFPDPNNFALGKLYTRHFYHLLRSVMHDETVAAIQSTSPLHARQSYWCIVTTLEGAGLATQPYHATVPSFGVWGYVLAKKHAFEAPTTVAIDGLRYLTSDVLPGLFRFAPDMDRVPVDENRLNDQRLVRYYEREWSALN